MLCAHPVNYPLRLLQAFASSCLAIVTQVSQEIAADPFLGHFVSTASAVMPLLAEICVTELLCVTPLWLIC